MVDAKVAETFRAALREYKLTLRTTEGTGSMGERYVDAAYKKLKEAAKGYPSLMEQVPSSAARVYADGVSGATGFGRAFLF